MLDLVLELTVFLGAGGQAATDRLGFPRREVVVDAQLFRQPLRALRIELRLVRPLDEWPTTLVGGQSSPE